MANLESLFQSADWKTEKHVPVISVSDKASQEGFLKVDVSVGEAVPHPNTTAHHIRWIALYFLPTGEKFPYELARAEFSAHGESTQGPDTGSAYTYPKISVMLRLTKPGTLFAASLCNIHGLWQSSKEIMPA
jgi:superoxide reductase